MWTAAELPRSRPHYIGDMVRSAALAWLLTVALATVAAQKKPNIVLVLVDDQDAWGTTAPKYMPNLNKLIRKKGVTIPNFFVSTAECCQTRTTLNLGMYAHNHNVRRGACARSHARGVGSRPHGQLPP